MIRFLTEEDKERNCLVFFCSPIIYRLIFAYLLLQRAATDVMANIIKSTIVITPADFIIKDADIKPIKRKQKNKQVKNVKYRNQILMRPSSCKNIPNAIFLLKHRPRVIFKLSLRN